MTRASLKDSTTRLASIAAGRAILAASSLMIGTAAAASVEIGDGCAKFLERSDVLAHVEAGGLIQFWIPGVASYQGRVVAHARDELTLRGQFGPPRSFGTKDLQDVRLLRNGAGEPVRRFTPITGLAIAAALTSATPKPGGFDDAVRFALEAHGPQIYNDVHYAFHLDAVVAVLARFGIDDPRIRIAAILHDVIEDTPVSYDEIKERFGAFVADAVRAVSLPGGMPRAEAFELAYPAIRATPGALDVKLADRIANVEDAEVLRASGDPRHFRKYASEYPHFRESLHPGSNASARRMFGLLDRKLALH